MVIETVEVLVRTVQKQKYIWIQTTPY